MNDALHILLTRYRQRLILSRAVRILGQACLIAASICLMAACLQRLTGSALLGRSALAACIIGSIYFIVQLRRWPTLAAAALEIDRQANLHELLSSAALADHGQDMSECVIAAAQQRAVGLDVTTLSPGSVGTRAWIATLLVVGLLPLVYRVPATAPETLASGAPIPGVSAAVSTPRAAASPNQRPQPIQEAQTPGASAIALSAAPDRAHPSSASQRPTRSDTAGISAGGGLAQGGSTTPAPAPAATPPAIVRIPANPGSEGAASGSGTAQANAAGMRTGSGQVAIPSAQTDSSPGSSLIGPAQGAINVQSFPEAYRDVLKAYFAH